MPLLTWHQRFRAINALRWGAGRERRWFALYAEYLESPEWAALRAAVIRRDRECRRCFAPGEVVHHLTYRRIGEEHMNDLMYLCTPCHEFAHETKARLKGRRSA